MRTTLTLDDDVAALLRKMMTRTRQSLKQIINEALRRGLVEPSRAERRARYSTRSVDLGRPLIGSLDDVAEVLAVAEGEAHR
jgi:hypothetical protein